MKSICDESIDLDLCFLLCLDRYIVQLDIGVEAGFLAQELVEVLAEKLATKNIPSVFLVRLNKRTRVL